MLQPDVGGKTTVAIRITAFKVNFPLSQQNGAREPLHFAILIFSLPSLEGAGHAALPFSPVVIIDEDFRSENTSGLGIRALADAIQKEGFEVLGVTSYGDLAQFAQQQSRASAFILSIDDEEFTPGPELDPAVLNLRKFIEEIASRTLTFLSTCTVKRARPSTFRMTSCASCTASFTCLKTRPSSWRVTSFAKPRAISTPCLRLSSRP